MIIKPIDPIGINLLQKAAIAAGYGYRIACEWHNKGSFEVHIPDSGPSNHLCWHNWNPIDDDGQALRLASRLGIFVRTDFIKLLSDFKKDGMESSVAARLAIVNIAAKIGELKNA